MVSSALGRVVRQTGVLLCIASGVFLADVAGLTVQVDNRLAELRFSINQRSPIGNTVLLDIDAKSLAEIGVWPWPRSLHGQIVDTAGRLGAARIAFDVDFSSASSPDQDQAFATALSEARSETFLAAFVQQESTGSDRVAPALPIPDLLDHSWPAMVNVPVDGDGQVRRFPSSMEAGDETLASMPAILAKREDAPPLFGIDYSIDAKRFTRISYVDLLRNRVRPEAISGKTLIVGATALELRDLFLVPANGPVSGSTIIALATETLAQNRELRFVTAPAALLAAVAVLALLGLAKVRSRGLMMVIPALATAVEFCAAWLQVGGGIVLQTANLHWVLTGLMIWALAREFDLRRLKLWIARIQLSNGQSILEHVINDGFDGVLILDDRNQVVTINAAAAELLGRDKLTDAAELPQEMRDNIAAARTTFRAGISTLRNAQHQRLAVGAGELRILEYSVAPFALEKISDAAAEKGDEAPFVCLMMRDVTERELAQERMRFLALHDNLTGLHNRVALEQRLSAASGTEAALLYFDLDRFKTVNDALGHAVGDQVLIETANRARRTLPGSAFVARVGGDEFCAFLPDRSIQSARSSADALATAIAQPFYVSGHKIHAGTSIGVTWWSGLTETPSAVMRQADIALYAPNGPGLAGS